MKIRKVKTGIFLYALDLTLSLFCIQNIQFEGIWLQLFCSYFKTLKTTFSYKMNFDNIVHDLYLELKMMFLTFCINSINLLAGSSLKDRNYIQFMH